jgi:hypothetical protein
MNAVIWYRKGFIHIQVGNEEVSKMYSTTSLLLLVRQASDYYIPTQLRCLNVDERVCSRMLLATQLPGSASTGVFDQYLC